MLHPSPYEIPYEILKSVSPDGLGKESAIKTQLGLIKQTTRKDVRVEAVIDFTLLRQVLAETK
jgi:hypothetical protein